VSVVVSLVACSMTVMALPLCPWCPPCLFGDDCLPDAVTATTSTAIAATATMVPRARFMAILLG
jgi:hypothetical protein